jgi:hypothetical protein
MNAATVSCSRQDPALELAKAEAERAKLELEKAKAEAEKVKAEAEKAKTEAAKKPAQFEHFGVWINTGTRRMELLRQEYQPLFGTDRLKPKATPVELSSKAQVILLYYGDSPASDFHLLKIGSRDESIDLSVNPLEQKGAYSATPRAPLNDGYYTFVNMRSLAAYTFRVRLTPA